MFVCDEFMRVWGHQLLCPPVATSTGRPFASSMISKCFTSTGIESRGFRRSSSPPRPVLPSAYACSHHPIGNAMFAIFEFVRGKDN